MLHLESFRMLDLLKNPEVSGSLGAEALYDLVLAATGGDEKQASQAASERGMARLRQNLPV